MRAIIDFNHVSPEQYAIHDRLINWAKWARGSRSANVHPMFRQYRNDYWQPSPSQTYTNAIDATEVQKVMKDLPEQHRIAVQWCYISRTGPTAICQRIGTNREGLMKLIVDGRAMLKNHLLAKVRA